MTGRLQEPTRRAPQSRTMDLDSDWQARLATIVATMKDMSRQTDPQEMVRMYAARMQQMMPVDRRISLSRRGLLAPDVRVTRFSGWTEDINPWKDDARLPILSGGLLSDLIYADEPRIFNDVEISPDDPAAEYLAGQRSLLAIPLYDKGVALNMVVVTREAPDAFPVDELPERVWMSNLFGRATHNLVLAEQLEEAYREVDRELQTVADMQRSLLPSLLPDVPSLKMATHYQTSKRAGGDYYDFFALEEGRWGLLVADVSGHGTPAAVMMAITHCIAHMRPDCIIQPAQFIEFLNSHLTARYTASSGHFVTAFYAVYDPRSRRLTYASAGHNPPRLWQPRAGAIRALDDANFLPLGIASGLSYRNAEVILEAGDRLVLYTDGIVEATSGTSDLFGTERLDASLHLCHGDPDSCLQTILADLKDFTSDTSPSDDRTLIVVDVVDE